MNVLLLLILVCTVVLGCTANNVNISSTGVYGGEQSTENATNEYQSESFTTIETNTENTDTDIYGDKIPIYLGGFLSIDGGVWDGSGLLPAIELALEHVNAMPNVLARYELKMVWNDSQVRHLKTKFVTNTLVYIVSFNFFFACRNHVIRDLLCQHI